MRDTARVPSPISVTKLSIGVAVAASALETDSVEGQRGRPSGVTRLDLLKVVGSSPAFLARPEGDSPPRVGEPVERGPDLGMGQHGRARASISPLLRFLSYRNYSLSSEESSAFCCAIFLNRRRCADRVARRTLSERFPPCSAYSTVWPGPCCRRSIRKMRTGSRLSGLKLAPLPRPRADDPKLGDPRLRAQFSQSGRRRGRLRQERRGAGRAVSARASALSRSAPSRRVRKRAIRARASSGSTPTRR